MRIGSCFAALRSGLFIFCALIASSAVAHAQANDLVAKGQYIFALAGGCACHSVPKETPVRRRSRFSDSSRNSLQHEYYTGQRDRSWQLDRPTDSRCHG